MRYQNFQTIKNSKPQNLNIHFYWLINVKSSVHPVSKMSANQTIVADVSSLTYDDLTDQYRRLADSYRSLKRVHEEELQANHELRRNLQASTEAANYLTTDLEQIDTVHREELAKVKEKCGLSLSALKDANADLKQQNCSLESTVEELQSQIHQLKEKIEELEFAGPANVASESANSTLTSEKEILLEKEVEDLKKMLAEHADASAKMSIQLRKTEDELENRREQLECSQDNLTTKKQELEELRTLLESTQEENMRLSSELAALRSAPGEANKKGNSLFAEVDDQRQKMIEMLQTQRKRYQEMKKLHSESEFQIRRLTRENRELCDEIEKCSHLFLKADNKFRDESSSQINSLREEVRQLQEQLTSTERKLIDKSTEHTNWVDPFVSYYRNETSNLKNKLQQLQMDKRLADEICHDAQRELSKWRFEALKSRYVIINRESLLEEHGLKFQPFDAIEPGIHINELVVSNAKPHVGFKSAKFESLENTFDLKDLYSLSDLKLDLMIPPVKNDQKENNLPPPAQPEVSNPTPKQPEIKEEFITPASTPLVTPNQSPKANNIKIAGTSSSKTNSTLAYRDIIYIPKDAPLSGSLKKKQFADIVDRITKSEQKHEIVEDKENSLQPTNVVGNEVQKTEPTKSWGWISETRTKNNIVVRRFKFPTRTTAPSDTQQE
ncbi:protein Spindly [Uranotaenia lowii]|uniref:protein Spindly n=1 Tax=Uranotaenia lowii TaxID=190385 RepID=UPI00247894CB|nr:protein Spindly [Uranotaenia lowii]